MVRENNSELKRDQETGKYREERGGWRRGGGGRGAAFLLIEKPPVVDRIGVRRPKCVLTEGEHLEEYVSRWLLAVIMIESLRVVYGVIAGRAVDP